MTLTFKDASLHFATAWHGTWLAVACIAFAATGHAQPDNRGKPDSRRQTDPPDQSDQQPQALSLDDLPPPPAELAELIEAGRVTFVIGGRRPSETKEDSSNIATTRRYDRGFGRRGRWGSQLSFDAETNFEVHLDYRSRCRWRVRWEKDERRVVVSIRFSNIKVEPTHVIWFKRPIAADEFWDSPLVRHEFDHVRLSVMVANQKSFADDLREHATIERPIEGNAKIDRANVLPLVDVHVKERFAERLDLIEIRYQELDRQTRHGTRPLDRESELFPMLRPNELE